MRKGEQLGFACSLAASLLMPLFGASCGSGSSAGRAPHAQQRPEESRSPRGAALYAEYCSLCHGDDGEGYAADNANALSNQDFLVSASDDFIRLSIRNGRPGTAMGPYGDHLGGPLDEDAVDAIVGFLRSFQHEADAAPQPGRVRGHAGMGAPLYAEFCAGCHGDEGEGRNAISLNNPEFLAHATDAQIRHAITRGRRDTPMPSFESELSVAEVDDLVGLIRSWGSPPDAPPIGPAAATVAAMDSIVVNPEGPAADFNLREGRFVPAAQLVAALERGSRLVLLDARPASNWLESHIPGAIPAPYYDVESALERLPRDGTWIVAYCGCPHAASGRVVDRLRDEGFENTAILDEGVYWWLSHGHPMEEGPRASR